MHSLVTPSVRAWAATYESVEGCQEQSRAQEDGRYGGYACQNPACEYYGVTDPGIHALVSAGRRGVRGDILYLRCQAWGHRQTSPADTPVRGLKTPLEQVRLVVMALAEGLDLSAASRIFRHHPTTIARWVERCGQHGARLHEQVLFRVIEAGHVQFDELVTRVKNTETKCSCGPPSRCTSHKPCCVLTFSCRPPRPSSGLFCAGKSKSPFMRHALIWASRPSVNGLTSPLLVPPRFCSASFPGLPLRLTPLALIRLFQSILQPGIPNPCLPSPMPSPGCACPCGNRLFARRPTTLTALKSLVRYCSA